MNNRTSRLIMTLGVGAALVAPQAALAKHGADDGPAASGDHAGQVEGHTTAPEVTGVDDHQQGESSSQPAQPRVETYDLRGTVVSDDPASSIVVMTVTKANHGRRGRALIGQIVTLDVSGARIRVADVNADGTADLNDVATGDQVEARVRLPRTGAVLTQPIAAQRFRDRSSR